MTQLKVDTDNLADRIEDAVDIDTTIETKNGEKELDSSTLSYMKKRSLADTLADYLAEIAMESPLIDSTTFAPGSGDTGRQSVVRIKPHKDVEKDELIELGESVDDLFSKTGIFPFKYILSVAHKMGIDEEGYPSDKDEFYLCFAYSARTRSGPQKPATQHTIISQ